MVIPFQANNNPLKSLAQVPHKVMYEQKMIKLRLLFGSIKADNNVSDVITSDMMVGM